MPTRCSGGSTSYSPFSIIHCLLKNLDAYLKPESQSTVTIVCPEVCVCVCVCVMSMRVYNKTKDTQAHSLLMTWPKHLGQANCAAHIQARRASNENALRLLGLEGIDRAF